MSGGLSMRTHPVWVTEEVSSASQVAPLQLFRSACQAEAARSFRVITRSSGVAMTIPAALAASRFREHTNTPT